MILLSIVDLPQPFSCGFPFLDRSSPKKTIEQFRTILKQLPSSHLSTLQYLLSHLYQCVSPHEFFFFKRFYSTLSPLKSF